MLRVFEHRAINYGHYGSVNRKYPLWNMEVSRMNSAISPVERNTGWKTTADG